MQTQHTDRSAQQTLSHNIAIAVAAYEAQHGPVVTLPIRRTNAPTPGFQINVPGKPKAASTARTPRRNSGPRKQRPDTIAKMAVLKLLTEMASKGASIEQMSEAAGKTRSYTQKLILENCIHRGPKMVLTA